MTRRSAGLLLYRRRERGLELFLVHPGGPFWAKKDLGAWSIPKGEYAGDEEALSAAKREFAEETGTCAEQAIAGALIELGEVRQPGGKLVTAWAAEGDLDASLLRSNLCEIEWPPRSGRKIAIPEVDRGAWFSFAEAEEKIMKGQASLLARLRAKLGAAG